MLDVSALLEEIKASPYEEMTVTAPHTGRVFFSEDLVPGMSLAGPSGDYKEKAGTWLAVIERERNPQPITCPEKGVLQEVRRDLHGTFVQAGEELLRFRHFLSREEVLQILLKKALYLFPAPERARYYFLPAIDIKIKVSGPTSVSVRDGDELFIMSRMKRETMMRYSGPDGAIYAVYFSHTHNVEAGQPLIGVCPPSLLEKIEEVVLRVQTEWKEGG